ncbi:MAG: DUF47 family protein [Thermoproteota archaeon]|jgi:Phosphate transport regulator (distant homolog of PhoU)
MRIKIINKVLEGGEENAIKRLSEIINIAIKASSLFESTLNGSNELERIKELEKKADFVTIELEKDISSGSVAPSLIDNFIRLVDLEDGIVDCIYNLVKKILRHRIREFEIENELNIKLKRMNELIKQALELLKNMHSSDNLKEIISMREAVEKIEEEGDEIKDSLLDIAYKKNLDFKSFYFIIEVAHEADNALDKCEDSADVYFTIMSSILS